MARHISPKSGKVWRDPVRKGGASVSVWLSVDQQAALQAYATKHALSLHQAAKAIIAEWIASKLD